MEPEEWTFENGVWKRESDDHSISYRIPDSAPNTETDSAERSSTHPSHSPFSSKSTSQPSSSNSSNKTSSASFRGTSPFYTHFSSQASSRFSSIRREAWKKPLLFYGLTWLSTTWIGSMMYGNGQFWSGFYFSVPLMLILTFHEVGHYIQSKRYGVDSTLPFFIPLPFPPFGTMGAVIKMDSQIPSLKALFDIGISGPLAGLIPTLFFMVLGIGLSSIAPVQPTENGLIFGEPLLFRWVSQLFFDRSIPNTELYLHPIAMAAWTGLFITSLNLFPVGQLDGGHVFYALLKRRAGICSLILFCSILFVVIVYEQWNWSLMLILVMFFGIQHPPTGNDSVSLGRFRQILGWLTLLFVVIGFTPNPIMETPPKPKEERRPMYALLVSESPQFLPRLPVPAQPLFSIPAHPFKTYPPYNVEETE